MVYAAQGVVNGAMSIGDLVLVNAFMLQLFIPLGFLGIVYRQIKYALADMDLVFKLLERTPEITDAPGAPALQLKKGAVRFEQVGFHYQSERAILHGVDFHIDPGEKVAVVGHSGAGKSTLARLLFRFYDPQQGRILIDGQDLRSVQQDSLRAAIGVVPQDTVLFNDSIRYNSPMAARTRARTNCARPPSWRTSPTSSRGCRTAGTPLSASAASNSPAARSSASPSPAPSSSARAS